LGFHVVNDNIYNPRDKVVLMEDPALVIRQRKAVEIIRSRWNERQNAKFIHKSWPEDTWLQTLEANVGEKSDLCLFCEIEDMVKRRLRNSKDALFHCLHSWRYELDGRTFEASPPNWADSEKRAEALEGVFRRRKTLKPEDFAIKFE